MSPGIARFHRRTDLVFRKEPGPLLDLVTCREIDHGTNTVVSTCPTLHVFSVMANCSGYFPNLKGWESYPLQALIMV